MGILEEKSRDLRRHLDFKIHGRNSLCLLISSLKVYRSALHLEGSSSKMVRFGFRLKELKAGSF
jgi:hypothetical protein